MGKKSKFLIEAWKGIRQALVISPGRAYVRPANNAFQIDAANLRNDAKNVGDDLKKCVKKYLHGKSLYQR